MATFLKDEKRNRFSVNFVGFCKQTKAAIDMLSSVKANMTALKVGMADADFTDDDRNQVQGILDAITAAQPSVATLKTEVEAITGY